MQKKYKSLLKILIVVAMIAAFIWFLVVSPMLTFSKYENQIMEAAKRYYDFHGTELPTGERVRTLSLSALYDAELVKGTYYAPISKKTCSVEKSWVKVRKENGDYKYYVFLDCGAMKSKIDHTGPEIKLKGKDTITMNIGDKYKDPGIESVVDDTDGSIDVSTVDIKVNELNTSKVGTYTVKYVAYDSLKNKTVATRTVKVVKVLASYIRKDLGDADYYTGDPENNYVRFSNMYFRIVGFTKNQDIILVAEDDVANVSYKKIEKWIDEVYLKSFTKEAKKLMVKHKFCKMSVKESELGTKKCKKYTESRYAYIPSIVDVNRTKEVLTYDDEGIMVSEEFNFMKPRTDSWVSDYLSSTDGFVTSIYLPDEDNPNDYVKTKTNYNNGVRPMIVIKKDIKLSGGDGSFTDPYVFGEVKKAKRDTLINKRYVGEYVYLSGFKWIIIGTEKDGATKILSVNTIDTDQEDGEPPTVDNKTYKKLIYNPKNKDNYGYYINNKASKYIDVSNLISHTVEAPVYKKRISYGDEIKTNKYKVKLSPPNMFDMFSSQAVHRTEDTDYSYWLINSSDSKERYGGAVDAIGVVVNDPIEVGANYGVRVVGYLKKNTIVTMGKGTYEDPYRVK